MIGAVRHTSRNVKRWQSGDMCLRWTAAGMLQAEQQFRKIIGYGDLAKLALPVERDLVAHRASVHTPANQDTLIAAVVSPSHPDHRHQLPRRTGQPHP